ncbi:hypothetical protein [Klebsiella pneumoniae]|uniref:hypothetical protein n=1 Tax=Klebsiella pneumoniae TaxID=573 RepID=UPI002B2677A7|nr:hypothetical protein [Klebsiella pneumoniae]MEA8736206.1 hypothetical protein [Klebsiella pneumoniae]
MSNIDKREIHNQRLKAFITGFLSDPAHDNQSSRSLTAEVFRIAQASLETEPVAFRSKLKPPYAGSERWDYTDHRQPDAFELENCFIERLFTAPPAPANAEPVAWLWSHRKHPSEVTLVRPEDDERAEGAHWSGWSCQALYAAPPAPASVPDEDLLHMAASAIEDRLSNKDRYCAGVWADIPAKLRRAAMLQGARNHPEDNLDMVDHSGDANEKGNSPVIPDGWVLVPVEPTEDMIVNGFESEPDESFSDEREWEAYDAMSGCQQAAHRARLCWAAMLAAAPRPEA